MVDSMEGFPPERDEVTLSRVAARVQALCDNSALPLSEDGPFGEARLFCWG